MPKSSKPINKFEGGLNTYSDARDVDESESPDINNFDVRKVGRLRLLGSFTDASATITNMVGETGAASPSPLHWDAGEGMLVFKTDNLANSAKGDETWVVFTDRATAQVYMYALSDSSWHELGATGEGTHFGLLGKIATNTLQAGIDTSVGYYFADGKLRIANTNFGHSSYITGVDGVTGGDADGASSLWAGFINKTQLSGAVGASGWHIYPAKIQTPDGNTFLSDNNDGGNGTVDAGAALLPVVATAMIPTPPSIF